MENVRSKKRIIACVCILTMILGTFLMSLGAPRPVQAAGAQNLAAGKPVTASGHADVYVASNVTDSNQDTYWESINNAFPQWIQVDLGKESSINQVVLKLPSGWESRSQTLSIQGSSDGTSFSDLKASASYKFDPNTANTVTIDLPTVSARYARINVTANTGWPAAQFSEIEIYGASEGATWTIPGKIEAENYSAMSGIQTEPTTDIGGGLNVGWIDVGDWLDYDVNVQNAGTYTVEYRVASNASTGELQLQSGTTTLAATKVPNTGGWQNWQTITANVTLSSGPQTLRIFASGYDFNINWINFVPGNVDREPPTAPSNLALTQPTSDTINLTWNAATDNVGVTGYDIYANSQLRGSVNGSTLTFTDNQPPSATVTYYVIAKDAAGNSSAPSNTVTRYGSGGNNTGRGANMPFTILEAESPSNKTNGTLLAPNFIPGDFAGEASGRSAVYLDATGKYVEFTLTSPANAFVLRNAVAENTTGTISVYVDGVDKGNFTVTSKFSYVYATPTTLGRLGYDNSGSKAYWLYEDSQFMLDQVYPKGTKIKIQKDAGDVPWIYVDMIETENVAPAASNPDPSKYVQVSSTKSIEQALAEFRQDKTKKGIFIPAGEWTISSKIYLYGRATEIIGAGPWHTKLTAPQNQTNTDVGFNIGPEANGSTIKNLSAWGNYVYRQDGPGKFIDGNGMRNVTIENVWAEHFICLYWGVNSSYNTFKNNRIKNMFADGINMTNGSSYNVIDNNYARGTGDDAFALFSAIDSGGSYNVGNKYTNLTATNVRRAAAFAVYGGQGNVFQNLYGADTLTYPGVTISSLSFGYNTLGFGDQDTVFDGVTLDRTGGDFWTSVGADDKINDYQNFGAIWFFGGDRNFKNILVKNVDINNPVYFGLMFQSKSPENLPMVNVRLENININNPTRYGIKLVAKAEDGQGPVVGAASFTNVKVNNPGIRAIYGQDKCPNFNVIKVSDNNW
ncbi:carbohydrate-binding protein [Paenibacillus donghaensis]|uniref:carbohydrate-binding protein n=1 Tax=Paenibacillus donghaensis TaxID=414771 RepID=UPI00188326B9|nr:carbohydrate-binding protein [Paenibacillus donghaensis]MBE9915492.1 carbohydrate-binding protein [Paenibacillus donghaensis]